MDVQKSELSYRPMVPEDLGELLALRHRIWDPSAFVGEEYAADTELLMFLGATSRTAQCILATHHDKLVGFVSIRYPLHFPTILDLGPVFLKLKQRMESTPEGANVFAEMMNGNLKCMELIEQSPRAAQYDGSISDLFFDPDYKNTALPKSLISIAKNQLCEAGATMCYCITELITDVSVELFEAEGFSLVLEVPMQSVVNGKSLTATARVFDCTLPAKQ